jgi:lysophospholipase L1-like esterase
MPQSQILLGPRSASYLQQLSRWLSTFPFGVNWPLDDQAGSVMRALSSTPGLAAAYNGDIFLADAPGISKKRVAFSDGTGIYGNLLTAALSTAWGSACHAEGGHGGWYKASSSAMWTDGVGTVLQWLNADGNNMEYVSKAADNNIYWIVDRGGTSTTLNLVNYFPPGWFHLFVTWSDAASRVRYYLNGELLQQNVTGVWSGALAQALLYSLDGVSSWHGWADTHVLVGGREPTGAEVRSLVNSAARIFRLALLGDSITAAALDHSDWSWKVHYTWKDSLTTRLNHAVAGYGITNGGLDAETAAAAADNADTIMLAFGANDDNAGDMALLRSLLGADIDALRVSNPNATLYCMNVLPEWTDNTGATPIDKANVRTAIATVCTAKGVACWDTFTTPWITAAQTLDGIHPTAAGHAAIAAQVLTRLS